MNSLAEISRICGVSLGTTSRALSGKPGVSEATRQRIISVANRHNYRPNRLVHAIQSGRSMTIGITCNNFRDEFAGLIIEGMMGVLYHASYDAIIINWDLCVNEGEKVMRTFAERRVDGLLMFPPADQPSPAYLQELRNFRRPLVVIDQMFPGCDYDFVGSQDKEGGFMATEHLLALGHRKIANVFHGKISTGRARFEGFQQAMMKHGVAIHERWLCEIQRYGSDEPYHLVRALLERADRPTALLAFNDYVAIQAIAAARDAGLRVPEDLSVVGFADLGVASYFRPRLTTLAQDPVELGRRAATQLLQRIADAGTGETAPPPCIERLPVSLVARDSSRPPRTDA